MAIDLRNIGAISPNGTGAVTVTNHLAVTGDIDITGTPAPQYKINGVPIGGGGVTSISPGSLTGAVTLQAGANVSITPSGQNIIIASTGGGSGSSQWIDIAGGGIYYGGGNVGIGIASPAAALHVVGSVNYDPSLTPGSPAAWILANAAGGELAAGILTTGPYSYWLQARAGGNVSLPLALNPSGGNVGVGTNDPDKKLSVSGDLSVNCANTNTGGGPDLTFGMGSGEGLGSNRLSGPNQFGLDFFTAGGTPRLSITNLGNVGIGTTSPIYRLTVNGGRFWVSNAESYCIGLSGSSGAGITWLGTDASANMTIHDTAGVQRYMFTQGGTAVINNSIPFDPGNPHLQVMGGICVNTMADNAIANIRMVSDDQTWGAFWRIAAGTLYLMTTNASDPYGDAKAPFPMLIDLPTNSIGLRAAPNASYGVNVDSINANALYRQGVEIVPPPPPSAGWNTWTPAITDGSGTPINTISLTARYSVFASWCAIMITFQWNPVGHNQTAVYIETPPVNLYQGIGGVAFAGFCYGDPNYMIFNAEFIGGPWINVQMKGNIPTPATLVQLRLSGVCELQA